jgi:magnesium transporter
MSKGRKDRFNNVGVRQVMKSLLQIGPCTHTILVYPNLRTIREVYSSYFHTDSMKETEMIVILPYYETIKQTRIDALYYNILAGLVTKYEQLLTAMELSLNEYQRRSFVRPLPEIFESIDILSRQAIMLRRQFWHVRNIINFLLHSEKDKEDVKYVEIVYDDITQLIDFVESYEGTINSIRELYVAKVSLQINETMRVLTIFTAILLPLALIASIYGMNGIDLENLTQVPLGFLVVLVTMAIIVIGFVIFFIKKGWIVLGRDKSKQKPES